MVASHGNGLRVTPGRENDEGVSRGKSPGSLGHFFFILEVWTEWGVEMKEPPVLSLQGRLRRPQRHGLCICPLAGLQEGVCECEVLFL